MTRRTVTLEDLGNIGELIAAVGVIFSLVYLSIQIRQGAMEHSERSRIESLVEQDSELRSLWHEHQEYERRLSDMELQSHLTPGELVERQQLKKLKLVGKDRIARILERHLGA